MCSTCNHNMNKNTIHDILRVMWGIKSHSNGGVSGKNYKGNCAGLLGYLETWFQPNGLGNILSFNKVEKLFVITYYHKEKTFVLHTNGEDNE